MCMYAHLSHSTRGARAQLCEYVLFHLHMGLKINSCPQALLSAGPSCWPNSYFRFLINYDITSIKSECMAKQVLEMT